MIQVEGLKKVFYRKEKGKLFSNKKVEVEAVKDVSLKIERGSIIGVLGINGAGKTTTIKMLTTLLKPTSGVYQFDNTDAIRNPKYVKSHINMIAGGERMIYWRLSAYENLWYYGQLYGIDNNVLKERIPKLLELVGLKEKQHVPVETYSKGMKQRLQIARGLINDPKYLFMDEPTIGLDAVVTKVLHQHIKKLAKERKKGILLTSHYLAEVEELCDYIYVLGHGSVIMKGTIEELSNAMFSKKQYIYSVSGMESEHTRLLIKKQIEQEAIANNFMIKIIEKNHTFIIHASDDLNHFLTHFTYLHDYNILSLYEKKPSLEDVILKIDQVERSHYE